MLECFLQPMLGGILRKVLTDHRLFTDWMDAATSSFQVKVYLLPTNQPSYHRKYTRCDVKFWQKAEDNMRFRR
jgi:hypothetical protein